MSRLRVPPCEKASGAISITSAPYRRAIATDSSRDPESHTSSSTAFSTRWAHTAASVGPRTPAPSRTGIATVTVGVTSS